MPVILRLRRIGAKKNPKYRIVAADSRASREGRFLELIGIYDPALKEGQVRIDKEKAQSWLDRGAQVSDTVKSLFKKQGMRVSQ